jgi:serine/threonine-protein kinase
LSGPPPDPSETEVDPLVGRAIGGKFVIERLLGAGAMGSVYRAHQTALERTVAVKVMHRELAAEPTYAARFHREAKAVSKLDHPNLIRILDYGQEGDGLLYIAMEFLDGRDLFSVIDDEWPLPHDRIVDILSQALSALAEAHDAGVLHRDLKPENIMLLRRKSEDGASIDVVKVCDFGIAKIVEEAEPRPASSGGARKLTAAGLVVGTPGYMAPEQARSEPCDARSDLYSVGVILYQLLTRRLPFEGNTPLDIVVKALHEAPPPLGTYGPTAAPGLEAICEKGMSKKPEERYQSARDMRSALRMATPIARQVVISSGDRPSIMNAPTQAELVTSAASTGVRAVPGAVAAPPSRFWRAGGVLAGLAIATFAVVSLRQGSSASAVGGTASLPVAAPPTATATALPEPVAPVPSPTSLASKPNDTAAVPPPLPSPPLAHSAPTRGASRPMHDVKESLTIAPGPSVTTPPAPPTPPPVEIATAAPTPSVAPPPVVPAPIPPSPPAAAPPTFDVTTARVDVGQARSNNAAATGSAVSRAVSPLAARFTGCYRAALARATSATEAPATLHLESDDQGYVTAAHVTGAAPPDAARCIEALVTRNVRIEVDTGTANADVPLTFKPL